MREQKDRQVHLEVWALLGGKSFQPLSEPMPWTPININGEGMRSEEKMSLAMYPPTKHYVESL